jgi:Flp pilus assembly protein TadD
VLAIDFRDRAAKVVLAHVAVLQKRPEEAKALLRQLGGENANESEAVNLLGVIAFGDGDVALAERLFSKAVERNHDEVAARMNLGIVQLRRANLAAAEKQFKEVLRRAPENPDAQLHLGVTYAQAGKTALAESAYRHVHDLKTNPNALYNLAVVLKRKGKFDEALDMMERYLSLKQLRFAEREAALALLEDLRIERAAKDPKGGEKVEQLIAEAREGARMRSGDSEADEAPSLYMSSVGAFYGH